MKIEDGDFVFIIYDKRRQWIRKIEKGKEFHNDRGYIIFNDIIGKKYGRTFLMKPSNKKVAIIKPLLSDIIYNMKRKTQIIYPQDIGLILIYGGIVPGTKILEAGTGSGTVTSILATYSKPDGYINSFDVRKKFLEQANRNIKQMGVFNLVNAKLGNILEEDYEFKNLGFIMLDLATTWKAVPKVKKYLSNEGRICCFSPTIEQVKKNVKVLKSNEFQSITTFELLQRTFQVKPNATRPHGRMIGHTGYLTFASLDDKPLLLQDFNSYHSPENIGNIIIYGGIHSEIKTLIVKHHSSNIDTIIKRYFTKHNSTNLFVLNVPDDLEEKSVEKIIKKYTQKIINQFNDNIEELFDTILIDNVTSRNLIKYLEPILKNGGTFSILSKYIEHMKSLYDQLYINKYYNVKSSELIKREIEIEFNSGLNKNVTKSKSTYNSGYITVGRKIADKAKIPKKKKPINEFVEPLLDVALNIGEIIKEQPKKIDYANLREHVNEVND